MRQRIALPGQPELRIAALRDADPVLYRRIADRGRAVLAVGARAVAEAPAFGPDGRPADWWFGHLAYGYKDRLERLRSRHADAFGWPLAHWFVPRWVVEWSAEGAVLHAHAEDAEQGLELVRRMSAAPPDRWKGAALDWQPATDRDGYLRHADALLGHLQQGDIYEVNYCIAHQAEDRAFDPFGAFHALLGRTGAPYAGFLRLGGRFALCASPERFIAMHGARMVGEPMKGTRPRSADAGEDERLRRELAADAKERSENVMAVDVMRNDFARVAEPGTVHVASLCEVRSYPRVHQMVSVVEARRRADTTPFAAVEAAFPMASMTGAPKIRAMQLIDDHEDRARGLYSGTMGFFAPDGTADLNVAIRTVLFDAPSGRLSIPTGSALTARCDPRAEWDECLVKLNSITHALAHAG